MRTLISLASSSQVVLVDWWNARDEEYGLGAIATDVASCDPIKLRRPTWVSKSCHTHWQRSRAIFYRRHWVVEAERRAAIGGSWDAGHTKRVRACLAAAWGKCLC